MRFAMESRQSWPGEAISETIAEGDFPNKQYSVLAAAYDARNVTVSIGISYGIILNIPAATARHSDRWLHRLPDHRETITKLEGGVMLRLARQSWARGVVTWRWHNVAHQEGRSIPPFHDGRLHLIPSPATSARAARPTRNTTPHGDDPHSHCSRQR
jgi:hypothetical protein